MIIFVTLLCLLVGVSIAMTCSTDYRIDNFLKMIDILEMRIDAMDKFIRTIEATVDENEMTLKLHIMTHEKDYTVYGKENDNEHE